MQEDPPIPDDPRIDRDPSEPIQPPTEDEPEDSPSRGEPERRDPGVDPPLQLGGEKPW